MGLAARVGDATNHPGTIAGPGVPTVRIEGSPAAVARGGAMHTCSFPPPAGPHPPTPFPMGSTSVTIGGMPALRVNDLAGCGASIVQGSPTVTIGG